MLSHAGVPFVVRNVEVELEAYRELLTRGFRTVPVTIIGDEPDAIAIKGFDERAIKDALNIV